MTQMPDRGEPAHDHRLRDRSARRRTSPSAPRSSSLGGLALVLCGWLLLVQWGFFPWAETGAATGARGIVVGLVVVLPAVRLVMGPHRGAAAVLAMSGMVLLVSSVLFDHRSVETAANEAVCGGVLLACGAWSALPPRRTR